MAVILQIDFNGPKWPYIKGKIQWLKDTYNVLVFCHKSTMGFGDENWTELGEFRNECDKVGVIDAEYAWPDVTAPLADQLKRIDALNKEFKPHWWGEDMEQYWTNWALYQAYCEGSIPSSQVPVCDKTKLATFLKAHAEGLKQTVTPTPTLLYTNYSFIAGRAPALTSWSVKQELWDAFYPYSLNPKSGLRLFNSVGEAQTALTTLPDHQSTFPGDDHCSAWQFTSQWILPGMANNFDLSVVYPDAYKRMSVGIVTPPPPDIPPVIVPTNYTLYHLYAQNSWTCYTYIHSGAPSYNNTGSTLASRNTSGKLVDIKVYASQAGWLAIDQGKTQWVWGASMTKI
jgi:hypothetical protein